jgi:hypothetical protein
MSATARAAGTPAGDRPGRRTPPPLEKDPVPLAARRRTPSSPPLAGSGRDPGGGQSLRTGPPATAAPARPARAHTAPVRTGTLRSRTAARPAQPTGPVPRTAAGSPASRLRSAVGAHRTPVVLLVVTLLVLTTLGLLFLNTAIAVNSLKATQLAAANEDRAQEVQRLEQQVVSGGTPAELARQAREAGLVPAGAAAYLVVGEDGTVTLRGEAVPAEDPAAEDEDPAAEDDDPAAEDDDPTGEDGD